jgi:hypothetical protein
MKMATVKSKAGFSVVFAATLLVLFMFAIARPVLAQNNPDLQNSNPQGGPVEVDPLAPREKTLKDLAGPIERRLAARDAMRRTAMGAARRRGITREEVEAMTPEQRAALWRDLRQQMAGPRYPNWRQRMDQRRRSARGELEESTPGRRHVRAQILATDPSPSAIATAQQFGFRIVRERRLDPLGVRVVVLAVPPGVNAQRAVERMRIADPAGSYDLNHVFDPSAASRGSAVSGFTPGAVFDGRGLRIGVIDTGVNVNHPALAGARITSRTFVEATGERETGHGTAVAALLVGAADQYEGVIPGASLFVADVFGASGAGGSAEAIAEALAWLDAQNVDVINISLEGPPNRTLEVVIAAMVRRGRTIVAAVGNEGPTQPVAFPAAYDGVIGVTAIDIEQRVYIAANRGPQVDLSALGVNVLTAGDGREYMAMSGTSFAAPLVAAAAAAALRTNRTRNNGLEALSARVRDLGAPGRDPVYGLGAVEMSPQR